MGRFCGLIQMQIGAFIFSISHSQEIFENRPHPKEHLWPSDCPIVSGAGLVIHSVAREQGQGSDFGRHVHAVALEGKLPLSQVEAILRPTSNHLA